MQLLNFTLCLLASFITLSLNALAEPVTVHGSGQSAETIELNAGLAIFTLTCPDTSFFSVSLLDADGDMVDLLANDMGAFDGSKATQLKADGTYVLQVNCDDGAAWTITADQAVPKSAPALAQLSGNGPQASEFFYLNKGLTIFQLKSEAAGDASASFFSVVLLDAAGNWIDLLANEMGTFDGSKAVKIKQPGVYLLNVSTIDAWTISTD